MSPGQSSPSNKTAASSNFSNGQPVSSIETEKSRIVLHELENGWWILASIGLTRLPVAQTSTNKSSGKESGQSYEYSSREVAPVQLLLAQLLRAHRIFLLHHASTLWETYHKAGRPSFCSLLERYWGSFVWDWDVLLHGNPAVDLHGCCTKLAGGGELGVGVGEEEWGSGEREVLEGFVDRTEGLVDLVVGRYGNAPIRKSKNKDQAQSKSKLEVDVDAWLGNGENPGPADGVVFSGTGMITRKSIATVSQWMEAIFKHGQGAYGIGENPNARPRERRKRLQRPKSSGQLSQESGTPDDTDNAEKAAQVVSTKQGSVRGRAPDLRRKAMENSAANPSPRVPAPLIGTVERSLDEATTRVVSRSKSRSPKSSPTQERSEEEAMQGLSSETSQIIKDEEVSASSMFRTDTMMKVLTLGYGSSWTLTPKGWQDQGSKKEHDTKQNGKQHEIAKSDSIKLPEDENSPSGDRPRLVSKASNPSEGRLHELDPTPAISDDEDEKPFVQELEKSAGKFLVGLSGDLDNTDLDEEDDSIQNSEFSGTSRAKRIFLRTMIVQVDGAWRRASLTSGGRPPSPDSYKSDRSHGNDRGGPLPKTSAGSSVDGPAQNTSRYEKVQVAVYVHQPFIFVFLFQLHTPSLTIPGFYHNIHHQLGPLQGPLLKRTDPERVAERIKDVIVSKDSSTSASTLAKTAAAGNVVFDLVYDPGKLTVRTSIPNIPIPASSMHEAGTTTKATTVSGSWYTLGIPISSPSSSPGPAHTTSQSTHDRSLRHQSAEGWTRIDALNVYGQILNTWIATRMPILSAASNTNADMTAQSTTEELERTVKTSRGWWVLWMKVIPQPQPQPQPLSQPHQQDRPPSLRPASARTTSTATQTARSHVHQQAKEAFLIRRATDYSPTGKATPTRSGLTGRWLLREQSRDGSRGSNVSGSDGANGGARSISEGVGIDARKWVEGLLHLSQ